MNQMTVGRGIASLVLGVEGRIQLFTRRDANAWE